MKHNGNSKRIFALILSLILCLSLLTSCGDEEISDKDTATTGAVPEENLDLSDSTPATPLKDTDTQWAIYWYLCGSDLETYNGCATTDLSEMLDVQLPEHVQIVIQTGGADAWQNELIDSNQAQRWLYDSTGLNLIEEFDPVNMGDAQTLADFLSFANENYPAQHTMVNFWNHGGGSVSGAAFDEQFGMDSLSLAEMYTAFTSVFLENPDNQPIDIIGFDTCLMATVDVAYTFCDLAKYLVASQELEPGNGWLYSGVAGTIADDPQIAPLDLSIAICDTFAEGCEEVGTAESITLSVTDLSYVNDLIVAYDDFGREALLYAVEDPTFFTEFSKIAARSENYGGNTREQGYTNMVDLGHLAELSSELLPETSSAVLAALNNCIPYWVNGIYRPDSHGLSCYYSYNGDIDDLNSYVQIGPSPAFKYLYSYGLTGELSDDGMSYISEMDCEELPYIWTLEDMGWVDMPLGINEDGCATIDLGPEAYDILSSIAFELYYIDYEEDVLLSLGVDNDIVADWDNGIFAENFRGVWGSLDDNLCYMELAYEGDDYNEYTVPILLNGEEYNLIVYYDFITEEFYIDGARKPLDESGAADKNLRYLVEGDEIQTILYGSLLSEESDDLMPIPVDTLIVTQDLTFAETELGDGTFMMLYKMSDYQNNIVYSSIATFESIDGEIYTTVE